MAINDWLNNDPKGSWKVCMIVDDNHGYKGHDLSGAVLCSRGKMDGYPWSQGISRFVICERDGELLHIMIPDSCIMILGDF